MTIKDILNRAALESPDRTALAYKRNGKWHRMTFVELRERAWHVSEMLVKIGVKTGDRVAIFHENSPEWYEFYYGIVAIGAVAVPVDVKLREQEISHIFHDCDVSVVFCATRNAPTFYGLRRHLRTLRTVVALDSAENLPEDKHLKFLSYETLFEEVSDAAYSSERAFDRPGPDKNAPASFIYTSGTTGRSKGAMLSHRNFIADVEGIAQAVDIQKTDNFMLVLPLHHAFAFTTVLLVPVYAQCQVSIVENLKTIRNSMIETSPTVLLAVPLLLEKMLARIVDSINSKAPARLFYRCGFGKLIGRKVHENFGGKLRLIISGGAPINPKTLTAWSGLGFKIAEGYGITETSPVLTVNPPNAPRIGTVGLPIGGVEIKIVNPSSEGIGEIVTRGDNVMLGYYNNPEETNLVLRNGWYYTGDLGRFDEKGYLKISGRKKSLIVNREGKNIYPEEIEHVVIQSEYVLESLAMGYREPNEEIGERVGLLVVPDTEVFDALEEKTGERLNDEQIKELVIEDVRKQLVHLANYKCPRKIQVRFEEFEKTTTQKIKRYLYAIDTTGR